MQVRVSASYGLTVPGAEKFSSENFRMSIDVEDEMTQEAAEALLVQLENTVKVAVINEARLTAGTDENGVTFPVFATQAAAPAPVVEAVASVTPIGEAPSVAPAPVQSGTTQGGGGKDMMFDGRPVIAFDNRAKKAAGEHKPNAADFRVKFKDVGEEAPDNVKYKGIWIHNQNGSVNQAGALFAQAYDAS